MRARRLGNRARRLPGFPYPDQTVGGEVGTRPPLLRVALRSLSNHEIDSGPALVPTVLLPDTSHFNGRGGRVHPVPHLDGSADVPTLLRHLSGLLGLDEVTAHDLAA
ncbi:hypothetical protein [Streptomyces rubrogriseus]|uniref:Uncharacterized protein n=1 Tax=Streptomyces rubrogriseus TaxID=194673 RepID=A0A6G3TEX7_9ACTN|nr:hypothetical protein [Streptomyces rubrogriseus]NEC34571.1 hypothetical protein [Streptomyces rubrogriseus]